MHYKLSVEEEDLGRAIIQAAFTVHKKLGPGLLEKIYEACFCYELKKMGISCKRQVDLPIKYDELIFDEGLRLDVLVEDIIICELKSKAELNPLWQAQIISHLKLTDLRLGYLINFNVPFIRDGIKRFLN